MSERFLSFFLNAGNYLAIIKRAAVRETMPSKTRARDDGSSVGGGGGFPEVRRGRPSGVGPGDSVVHQKRAAELKERLIANFSQHLKESDSL